MDIAVYLFTGFLEAGKTTFIKQMISEPGFIDKERKYLIIQCEEGEDELDESLFGENVFVRSFTEKDKLTPDRLSALQKRTGANIIILEYNGMWQIDDFFNAMPDNWAVFQEVFIADSTNIFAYNKNMRSLIFDKLSSCDMVVFNRADGNTDREQLHKLVRAVSRNANICYESADGEVEFDTIEDPLPFDLNSPVVEIKDDDFALFYSDIANDQKKYDGKVIKYKGLFVKHKKNGANECFVGRHVMTCCQDDIQYLGFLAKSTGKLNFMQGEWVMVEGKIKCEYSELYKNIGPVIYISKITKSEKPINEVATIN